LKEEQQEYVNQKIPWSEIYFRDNKECVDLFEKRPLGIFSLLDEECRFPQATDQTLLSKLHKHHENNTCYIIPKFGSNKSFIIKHFAGDVEYDVKDFLLKNKDSLPPESLTLISHSSFPLLKDLIDSEDDQALQRGRQKTVTSQFRVR
jgi:myosin heavy subunit